MANKPLDDGESASERETEVPALPGAGDGANTATRIADGLCPHCAYDMHGLAVTGKCPECGFLYTNAVLLPLKRLPGALELWLRFAWPLMAFIGSLCFPLTSRDPYGFLGWMFIAMLILIAMLINAAGQAVWLARACVRPEARGRRFGERLRMLGSLAVTLYTLTLVAPAVIVGGCVVLVCAGSMG